MYLHEYASSTRIAKFTDMLVLVQVANVFFLVNEWFAKYVDHARSRRLVRQIDRALSNIFLGLYVRDQFSVSRFFDSHRILCHSSYTGRSRRQIPVDIWNNDDGDNS